MNIKNKDYSLVYFSSKRLGKIFFNGKNTNRFVYLYHSEIISLFLRFIKDNNLYGVFINIGKLKK